MCWLIELNTKNYGQGLFYTYFLHEADYLPCFDFPWRSLFELFAKRGVINSCWIKPVSVSLVSRALKYDSWNLGCQELLEAFGFSFFNLVFCYVWLHFVFIPRFQIGCNSVESKFSGLWLIQFMFLCFKK